MPAELQVLIRHIRRVAGRRELANRSDRELLAAYALERNEEAFTELVRRHALLVAGVCRRVLRNEQDIEDVFQATFLVLSRKARTVSWHESAANWLHSVAFHLAIRSRKIALRQQKLERESQWQPISTSATSSLSQARELQELLDQELTRLPEACRSALILCYLEGRTRDQAARQSGLSLRTLDRRLELGRQLLRDQLARRGLDLSAVVLAAALGESANAGYTKLVSATAQYVMRQASLKVGFANSALKLANSAFSGVSANSLKIVAGIVLTIALAGAGVGIFSQTAISAHDSALEGNAKKSQSPQKAAKPAVPQPHLDHFGDPLPEGAVARLGGARFRAGHPQMVAYSADGKLLFVGTQTGIRVFESGTGRLLRNLGGDLKATCWTTGVSPDGKLVAVGGLSANPIGSIYETSTGKRLCSFRATGGADEARFGAFSPNGKLLATIASRSKVDLYDCRTGELVRSLELEPMDQTHGSCSALPILEMAFFPDGKKILTGTHATGIVRIYDVQSGAELRRFIASPRGIAHAVLSSDGARLAVLESDARPSNVNYKPDLPGNKITIFDVQAGRQIAEIHTQTIVLGMALSRDGKTLFTGKEEKDLTIWDTTYGRQMGTVPFPYTTDESYIAMALSPDGKTIARQGTAVHVCDIATGRELECHPGHNESIISIAVHPHDSIVATGGSDGRLLLWDRTSGRLLLEVLASTGDVNSVIYSPDGRYLFAIAERKYEPQHCSIRCWNATDGKEVWRLDDHPIFATRLAISPDGKIIGAIGNSVGLLIDSATGRPLRTLENERSRKLYPVYWDSSTSLAFSLDGRELLAWGDDNTIDRWDTITGEHQARASENIGAHANAVAFSPDRKLLALGGMADRLIIVDVVSGKKIRDIKAVSGELSESVETAAFSPDGRTLAWSGPADGIIRLVDVGIGALLKQLKSPHGARGSIAFSSDGKTLVTNCGDGTALVWALK